ncbi:glycosyltransferase family 39 protein [Candidatus Pacearchaeota archaeon]|nr:glycosyltransferase family 39 protein [Candidatus Pacearchaeota archaeon]
MKFSKKISLELILLIVILAFAFFLRVYALGNSSFWVDESISVNIAKNILDNGQSSLVSGFDHGAYFLHYSMAFFMSFSQNEFFARFVSVLFGLATIILVFFIGKEYSKSAGIISSLFFAIFYLEVFFSRQARYYQLFQLAFFLAIYLLHKSEKKPWLVYPALIAFFITLDTHLEGLVLAPFFILHILAYNRKQWFLAILPLIPLFNKFKTALGLSAVSSARSVNYAPKYLSYFSSSYYLLVLFVPGVIWGFFKQRKLTLMILLPSLFALAGIFSLETFAFRYAYFFIFPILLFSAVLMSLLYEKYGKLILLPILLLLLVPSNLFFPQNYSNIILPIDYNFNDYSAPYTDYKAVPLELRQEIISSESLLISYFSTDVSFYLRKPDFVLPFSLNGMGSDQISYNNSKGETVDRYSGAPILTQVPEKSYYLTADSFSVSKLKPNQRELFNQLTVNCTKPYSARDLIIFKCIQ